MPVIREQNGISPMEYKAIGPFYSADDFCRLFNLSYRTFLRYVKSGKIKAHKMNLKYRIAKADLQEFIDNSRVQPTA